MNKLTKIRIFLDSIMYFFILPFLAINLIFPFIQYVIEKYPDQFISKLIRSFDTSNIEIFIGCLAICLCFFGSIHAGIYHLNYRGAINQQLKEDLQYKNQVIGIATLIVLVSTIALNELQFTLITSWVAFVALLFSLFSKKHDWLYYRQDKVPKHTYNSISSHHIQKQLVVYGFFYGFD